MANNNVINDKKKALLAYKEKILDEIKYYERRIVDFRTNHKNDIFYDDHADSSDSEDDFPCAIDTGPSIPQLKLQQAMMKTCLHATQELTSLMVLQSEVNVLVEEPKFEGERPVKEPGTWREVTADCRIDLVPFTMTFYMHTPDRKFAPPSYRGLRVAPVKSSHEMELSSSVLHSLKVPSDAVEVLRSYAAGYRSRRTTLARLADKYTSALFMEPHAEGGFVLKCADLLEVSWRLENKWSPVAPFHHRMKFDLEYMDETYIKIITQAHKQLLDPALQTDERTLLLAKIITTCLEARGPIDPESDLESKTTERDNDIDKRESENERRDSEVMAPPKSLPKKGKQKNKDGLSNAVKRSMGDDNGLGAKRMKSNAPNEPKRSIVDNNARKTSDVVSEIGKKKKFNEVDKVASGKNVKDVDGNTEAKNAKEIDDNIGNVHSKPKVVKESATSDDVNSNIKAAKTTKNKVAKENTDTAAKNANSKAKNMKEPANTKLKTKSLKETGNNQEIDDNVAKDKAKGDNNKDSATKNTVKETIDTEKVKKVAKNIDNDGNSEDVNEPNTKTIDKKKTKNLAKGKSKENIDSNKGAAQPVSKIAKMTNNDKNTASNVNKIDKAKTIVANKAKNDEQSSAKAKNVTSAKNDEPTAKIKNVANAKNDEPTAKAKNIANAKINEKTTKVKNVASGAKNDGKTNDAKNVASANNDEQTIKVKKVASAKNNEQATKRNNVASAKNDEPPVKKIASGKNDEHTAKAKNVAGAKNDLATAKEKDIDSAKNDAKNTKVKKVSSAKNNEQITKAPQRITNVANSKNDEQAKVSEKIVKNKEKLPDVANKVPEKIVKEKIVKNKNDVLTVKKVTEKNATNRIKDKISQINTKVTEKDVKDKPINNIPGSVLNSNVTKNTKEITQKNTIKKPIINKIASHRNSLKPQNSIKTFKAGNTKASTGNTKKENGGKATKIPQKKLSITSEGSSKKNMLRMSPRQIPSKFKALSQETFKQKMVKSTNIPRLLKKPAPKVI